MDLAGPFPLDDDVLHLVLKEVIYPQPWMDTFTS